MVVSSKAELKNYVLRKLGAPVLKINIDDSQIDDRLDDALAFFYEFHLEGREEIFLKRKITASTLTSSTTMTGTINKYEKLIGQTSGNYCYFYDTLTSTTFRTYGIFNTFTPGETLVGQSGGGTLTYSAYVNGDYDNKWIPADDKVLSVIKFFPLSDMFNRNNNDVFDVQYQFALDTLSSITSIDLQSYYMYRQQLALIERMFGGERGVRFNRYTNRIYLDMAWNADRVIDRYVILQCHAIVDPVAFNTLYGDRWLRSYATAQVKQQWGTNLKKFGSLQLPGGVTLNGKEIYDEATSEIKELEEFGIKTYQEPPRMMIG